MIKIEKGGRLNTYRQPAEMGVGIRDTHSLQSQPPKVQVRALPLGRQGYHLHLL
jgi:hypothetical protein